MTERTLTRREFLKTTALAAGAVALTGADRAQAAGKLATRVLGRTGYETSLLALGLGAAGDGGVDPGLMREITNLALDAGVNYLDTAPSYHGVQPALGPVMAQRRREAFLVSKVEQQTREGAAAQIEQARRDLQTDVLDAVFIHNLGDFDPDQLMSREGAFQALREARDAGRVRFLGVSGHNRAPRFPPIIRTDEIDLVMVPANFVDRHLYRFEEEVLPVAREHRCGVLGMKVLGGVVNWNYQRIHQARLGAPEHYDNAVRYTLSLEDVATAVMGLCTVEEVEAAIAAARAFRPLTAEELAALLATGEKLAPEWGYHLGPAA